MLLVILFLLCDADGHLHKRRAERSRERRDTAAAGSWFTGSNAIHKTAKHVGHPGWLRRLSLGGRRGICHNLDEAIFQHHIRPEVFHSQIEFSRLLDRLLWNET